MMNPSALCLALHVQYDLLLDNLVKWDEVDRLQEEFYERLKCDPRSPYNHYSIRQLRQVARNFAWRDMVLVALRPYARGEDIRGSILSRFMNRHLDKLRAYAP